MRKKSQLWKPGAGIAKTEAQQHLALIDKPHPRKEEFNMTTECELTEYEIKRNRLIPKAKEYANAETLRQDPIYGPRTVGGARMEGGVKLNSLSDKERKPYDDCADLWNRLFFSKMEELHAIEQAKEQAKELVAQKLAEELKALLVQMYSSK